MTKPVNNTDKMLYGSGIVLFELLPVISPSSLPDHQADYLSCESTPEPAYNHRTVQLMEAHHVAQSLATLSIYLADNGYLLLKSDLLHNLHYCKIDSALRSMVLSKSHYVLILLAPLMYFPQCCSQGESSKTNMAEKLFFGLFLK